RSDFLAFLDLIFDRKLGLFARQINEMFFYFLATHTNDCIPEETTRTVKFKGVLASANKFQILGKKYLKHKKRERTKKKKSGHLHAYPTYDSAQGMNGPPMRQLFILSSSHLSLFFVYTSFLNICHSFFSHVYIYVLVNYYL
ncbi:hypothetical protein ACJX0J_024818, partial [Zea mays]